MQIFVDNQNVEGLGGLREASTKGPIRMTAFTGIERVEVSRVSDGVVISLYGFIASDDPVHMKIPGVRTVQFCEQALTN